LGKEFFIVIEAERLEGALSLERFGRYMEWAGQDRDKALELYALNTRLSEALYTPLQMLEIALRNRIHAVMTASRHEWWFDDCDIILLPYQRERMVEVWAGAFSAKRPITSGQAVASLTFGFWTGMFSAVYEDLWRSDLHKIAIRPDGKSLTRSKFASALTPIRLLRNRIAHHEPIIYWNLPKEHQKIVDLTECLSPAAAAWSRKLDRFDEVHPPDRTGLPNRKGQK
jgi:hypothetical protein